MQICNQHGPHPSAECPSCKAPGQPRYANQPFALLQLGRKPESINVHSTTNHLGAKEE